MVNFPTQILNCDSHSPALLDLFLSFDASICSTMAFPPLGNSDHVVLSVSIEFLSIIFTTGCPILSHTLWLFLCWLGWALWSFERCFIGDIFKLRASSAASEFCEWVQVGIDVYIPYRKYQVKPHSSSWFSAAYAAARVHRNYFFRTKRINLLIPKYSWDRLVIVKRFLKLSN